MDGLLCLGVHDDDAIGFDYGSLFQTAGGLTSGVITAVQADEAASKQSGAEQKALQAAVAADVTATAANARAAESAAAHGPSADVDALAATTATAAQDAAGAGLSDVSQKARASSANKQLNDAIAKAQAKPTDKHLAALVKAWTATVNKLQNGAITADGGGKAGKKGGGASGSWFTRPVIGPLPGAAVLVIGAGAATGVGFAIKKLFFK